MNSVAFTTELWAKKNRKVFARNFLERYNIKTAKGPAAIFMAGLPGAGKTEISKAIDSQLSPPAIRLDMDEIATKNDGYQPDNADKFRRTASILLTEIFDQILHNKLSFIMDGTFSGSLAIKKN